MGQKIKQTEIKEVIRSVVRDNIKEVTTNDWHFKAIMAIWDKGGSFTRKKIGTILLKDPNANKRDIEDALRNSDYDEVTDVTDRLRIEGVITEGEDNIPGGLAKGMTLNDIAEKHGVSIDVLVAEFKKGIQTEMEHTTDREVAKEITMDHLFEDPQYYTKLSSVEEYVDDKGVEHVAASLPQTEEEPIKEEEESEETLKGLKEMAMGDLERIADYAKMILERMGSGQELDSWMYSQITLAVDQLNSVHDTMDGNDGIKESVNEETQMQTMIRKYADTKPEAIYYVFYKGQFEATYAGTFGINTDYYWDKFKVRRPKGSQFKINPEFIIVSKKTYDAHPNHYAKLKPYVDKFWDKLQNESVNEEKVYIDYLNKQKGFKQDRIKFNSYEEAVKWARKNFEKFNPDMIKYESVNEENPGLWANIRAKRARGEEPAHGNSDAHKDAVKAGKEINKDESVNEGLKHLIHVESPKEIVSKSVASQIMALAKKGVRSNEIGLNMHFVGNEKAAVDAFQKVKNKVYFALDTQNESVNEGTEPEVITQIKTIAKNHQHDVVIDPKSGKKMKVDAFSASAIATVYDALSDSNKEKFVASGLLGMQSTAMKLLKR